MATRRATNGPPPVLYEDGSVIAFDKPAGMLVAPDRWDKAAPNLIQWVHRTMSPAIFNVHRLDRDTSGVLLCARDREALRALVREFESRSVRKRYVALVRGAPAEDELTIDLPLLRTNTEPYRVRVDAAQGKPSTTVVRVLEKWRGYSLVEAMPLTGRTHQIRVHLSAARCPIVSDPFYGHAGPLLLSNLKRDYKHKEGPEQPLMGRLALHAESLCFRHPATHADITVRSPLPKDFEISLRYLRRFAPPG